MCYIELELMKKDLVKSLVLSLFCFGVIMGTYYVNNFVRR